MKRVLAVVAVLAAFLIANRAAFEGYFSDDDLDNLSWAMAAGADSFVKELVTPVFSQTNTRPTGGLFYRWAGMAQGLNFEGYLPLLFGIHWLNAGLLYWLLRRKEYGEVEAAAATVFFLFHAALLEAWWKPMYIFDLLAATFCLVTWLAFGSRWWWLGLASFWLAYKSKEVSLFFPVVLALEDWKRALPFLAISGNFGLQALTANRQRESAYTLRFELASLVTTLPFYAKQLVLNKFGLLVVSPLALFGWRREVLLAGLGMVVLMTPLLFLPGRLFSVYLYVPLLVLMPGLAACFGRMPRWALATGLAIFLVLDYNALREKRKTELALGHEARAYVTQLRAAHAERPLGKLAFFENSPAGYQLHGLRGALRLVSGHYEAKVLSPESAAARAEAGQEEAPTLAWFAPKQELTVRYHRVGEAKLSQLDFGQPASAWQLLDGWHDREGHFRWTGAVARLRLLAAEEFSKLRVRFNNGNRVVKVEVSVEGDVVGRSEFQEAGTPTIDYVLPRRFVGPVEVEIRASPVLTVEGDDRELGVALFGIGFVR